MKKILILLAVATLPAASGCACARLCPCCPCNWFNRPAYCAPAPAYAAPYAASPCAPATYVPSPCAPSPYGAPAYGPMAAPLAATVMPQYMAPPAGPMMTQAQPMYYQQAPTAACCAPEPSCGYAAEPGCGAPYMNAVSYGPMMDCGPCNSCDPCGGSSGGCSSYGGGASAVAVPPAPEKFDPSPATE